MRGSAAAADPAGGMAGGGEGGERATEGEGSDKPESGAGCVGWNNPQARVMVQDPVGSGGDNPLLVLTSGILLLGAISLFIAWGLGHAYAAS